MIMTHIIMEVGHNLNCNKTSKTLPKLDFYYPFQYAFGLAIVFLDISGIKQQL